MNRGRLSIALALGFFLALLTGAARAQTPAICAPAQTVSGAPDANGRYTTTLSCADTAAAEGAADYRHLHYNQGPGTTGTPNPEDRTTTLENNNADNNVRLTIPRGVVFTATGGANMNILPADGAIVLWRGGGKTLDIEEGAVINLQRTPGGGGTYPSFQSILTLLTGVYVESEAGPGSDLTVRHDGVLNVNYRVVGGYAAYQSNTTGAITAIVQDTIDDSVLGADGVRRGGVRRGGDILLELGATGVVRHLPGSAGMGGVFGVNRSDEGGVTINLAEGSLVDITEGGGAPAVVAFVNASSNNARDPRPEGNGDLIPQTGDIMINAAGTIRAAVRNRGLHGRQGVGIRALNDGAGAIRITSSGTVETLHAHAIYPTHWGLTSTQRDDLNTEEIEGNLIDVTAGKVLTRGGTAIHVDTRSANAAGVVRVGEGATVRAEIDKGADAAYRSRFGLGNYYIQTSWVYGWRPVDTDNDGANDALHPIIVGIYMRRTPGFEVSNDSVDRVIVHGTVETEGGQKDVDAAIFLDQRVIGHVEIGATGRVTSDSGLAIASGVATPADADEDYAPAAGGLTVGVAGSVVGDIRVRDDGDLDAVISESGEVAGNLQTMGAGDLRAVVSGLVVGDLQALGGGDLIAHVSGSVVGDVRAAGGGALTVTVPEGGSISGTVHDPTAPMTVHGRVGRVLLGSGGTVTVAKTGRLTGVGGEAIRSGAAPPAAPPDDYEPKASDLVALVAGTVTGDIRVLDDGDLRALVSGTLNGDLRTMGAGDLTVSVPEGGAINGTVHDPTSPMTIRGRVGRVLLGSGGTVTVAKTGRLTGVEGDGDAIRSEAGDLSVAIAGTVEGDIRALGDFAAVVSGTVDGSVVGAGSGDHRVSVRRGGVVTGEVHLAASRVRVDGRIGAARLDGGGAVTVGAEGVISGMNGVAIRGGDGTLSVSLELNGRRLRDVVGGRIVGGDGETIMVVNGARAADGMQLVNGAWDLTLRAGSDGTFSPENSIETLGARAGVYESLPGLLLRMESGRARGEPKATAAGSPVWARVSTEQGSRAADLSAAGADYDFSAFGAEAGLRLRLPWAEGGLAASLSVRHQKGSAETSMPSGEGEIELEGVGLGAGLSWNIGEGWYVSGGLSLMEYDADLSSKRRGKLRAASASVLTLDAEAGARLAILRRRLVLAPRAWISRSGVSIDSFTDAVGASFRLLDGTRVTAGGGLVVETRTLPAGGGNGLFLRGSVDYGSVLSGEEIEVEVSGHKLRAEAEKSRLLMGLGAKWRRGRLTLGGEVFASGAGTDDETYGGRLSAGLRF